MKLKLVAILSVFLVSACATSGSDVTENKATDAGEKVAQNDSDLVCKREKIIGSNFSKKVCFSRDSMEDTSDESKQRLERMRNQRGGTTGITN